MGLGDDLISSGLARVAQQTDPRKVRPMLEKGFRWSEVWRNNPRIVQPGEVGDFNELMVRVGFLRPYMTQKTAHAWRWKEYKPPRGELYFSDAERSFAEIFRPQVVIEPTIKQGASPNKQWGLARWAAFVKLCAKAGIRLTQLGPYADAALPGVSWVQTPDFRRACAVLANAAAYVGHEGATHHAAAALGIPAVVIFGGFISPAQTGYDTHRNLFTGGEPCGMRVPCAHCEKAMAAITPEQVFNELRAIL